MEYRQLGRSGLMVSQVSIGSWITFAGQMQQDAIEKTMYAAYDAGINYFDGAEAYGSGAAEEAMGKVFKKAGWARDTLIISTKVIRIGEAPRSAAFRASIWSRRWMRRFSGWASITWTYVSAIGPTASPRWKKSFTP